MKKYSIYKYLIILIFLFSRHIGYASEPESDASYLQSLKAISQIEGNGSNELLTLLRESSDQLVEHWSAPLATEIARVFNLLLDANQNYFLVELIEPAVEGQPDKFPPVLEKGLSDENYQLYKELLQIERREEIEGNG
ncbi:hypothetical protein [Marinobacterium lutimaris]|uniref:Uncharacterized protein n=1 Tax=Marinobacterium lutimaris TaxID=568106 RepID=A0A1H5YRL8_9GAMM|nr:hypothetical protein [Marinobacterium lutimaris]SEG25956.1 hypothetical protein SAMN05444390_1011842 [Marinobacterium lutimaris]